MLKKISTIILVFLLSNDVAAGLFKLKGEEKSLASSIIEIGEELMQSPVFYLHNDSPFKVEIRQQKDTDCFEYITLMKKGDKTTLDYWGKDLELRTEQGVLMFSIKACDLSVNCRLRFYWEEGNWFTNYDIYCNDHLLKEYNYCVGLSSCAIQ